MVYERSYYIRRIVLPSDEFGNEGMELYIKIPAELAPKPEPDQMAILIALSMYYGVDGYLLIDNITELMDDQIIVEPFGPTSNIPLLITAKCEYDDSEEIIGMITPYGEFSLGFLDEHGVIAPILDDDLREALDLRPSREVMLVHNQFLESIDCSDCNECVYIPNALYTI